MTRYNKDIKNNINKHKEKTEDKNMTAVVVIAATAGLFAATYFSHSY